MAAESISVPAREDRPEGNLEERSEPALDDTPDECRLRLEPMWSVADSFLLVPPFLEVPLDRLMNYTFALADTFYA